MSDTMQQILGNPTLHPDALTVDERLPGAINWHGSAASPRSSQALCMSAFGTLRAAPPRDEVLDRFVANTLPAYGLGRRTPHWDVYLEHEDRTLLSEYGRPQPTSVDALLVSSRAVVAVEAKFVADAAKGFGTCSKFAAGDCAGFYGPGSDRTTMLSGAWCQLESWRGHRSPRTYWALGREYFRPEVFRLQTSTEHCPLRNGNYQLMRNFLFAAAYSRKQRCPLHGVVTIAPAATSGLLADQVAEFQSRILLPEYATAIAHATYETYAGLLRAAGDPSCAQLAGFLGERIDAVVDP